MRSVPGAVATGLLSWRLDRRVGWDPVVTALDTDSMIVSNSAMARGWESKSVEDQIGDAEAEKDARSKPFLSPAERERQTRKQSLLLSRSQLLSRLKVARNARYRTQLEAALEYVEKQLQESDSTSSR